MRGVVASAVTISSKRPQGRVHNTSHTIQTCVLGYMRYHNHNAMSNA